jgi:hypothetical protein
MAGGKSTFNKSRDQHPPSAVINRNKESIMGKNLSWTGPPPLGKTKYVNRSKKRKRDFSRKRKMTFEKLM